MGARQSIQTAASGQQPQQRQPARTVSTFHGRLRRSSGRTVDLQRTSSLPNGAGLSSQRNEHDADSEDSSADEPDSLQPRVLHLPTFQLGLQRFRAQAGSIASSSSQRHHLALYPFFDIKCPVCNKTIPSDEAEIHLVICLTRPRITYNEDVLLDDKSECIICFDEMLRGDTIARLPCLCIYHKDCIDLWFKEKNCCPEHPGDD